MPHTQNCGQAQPLGPLPPTGSVALLMDSAYEGNETRELAQRLGFIPVVPPHPERKQPWKLDKRLYRQRNQVERLFRRLKAWRRVLTRYDKLDGCHVRWICHHRLHR